MTLRTHRDSSGFPSSLTDHLTLPTELCSKKVSSDLECLSLSLRRWSWTSFLRALRSGGGQPETAQVSLLD